MIRERLYAGVSRLIPLQIGKENSAVKVDLCPGDFLGLSRSHTLIEKKFHEGMQVSRVTREGLLMYSFRFFELYAPLAGRRNKS